jgi:hypothetical protein
MVELTAMAEAAGLQPVMAPAVEQSLAALAQLPWEPQDPRDQAALARGLPVQEVIQRLAAKGLRQAAGEPAR